MSMTVNQSSQLVATSLEIDVMQANELNDAFELAVKYRIPAIIVHPDLISQALYVRGLKQGQFKIITPVDWPKGDRFGMAKMQGMKTDALSTDGYEILITQKEHKSEIKKEITVITDFIRRQLAQTAEVRLIIDSFTRDPEYIETVIDVLKECPTPNLVRNDHHTKAQQSKANTKVHKATIDSIKAASPCALKISGNVGLKTIVSCQQATRFGVNLKQAQNIIKDAREDPDKLQKLMAAGIQEEG